MRLSTLSPVLSALLSLPGCLALSQKQCRAANWSERGERDAYNGHLRDLLNDHRKAYADHDVMADEAAYNNTWDKGIRLYTTPLLPA